MIREVIVGLALVGSTMAQPTKLATLATPASASSFVLAKDGKVGAALCEDQKLRLWALPEVRAVREIDLDDRNIYTFAISGDGVWIAVADFSGLHTVWNASTGAQQMQFKLPYYPFAMVFSPDGKRLAVAPAGEPVQVYDVGSGQKLLELQRTVGGSQALAFSRDGRRIATADSDTVVRIYDAGNGESLARHTDFLLEPLAASFTADGKRLLAAGADKVIAILDASNGNALRKSKKLVDPVAYLEVSPNGTLTAAGMMHADNLLMPAPLLIMDTETGQEVQKWMPTSRMLGGRWTSDGRLLAAIGTEEGLQIWRVR